MDAGCWSTGARFIEGAATPLEVRKEPARRVHLSLASQSYEVNGKESLAYV